MAQCLVDRIYTVINTYRLVQVVQGEIEILIDERLIHEVLDNEDDEIAD